MAVNKIKTYRGQADSNATTLTSGTTVLYTYNMASLFNITKVATLEAYAVIYNLQTQGSSAGWIRQIAPLNTGVAFGSLTFAGPFPRPNLPDPYNVPGAGGGSDEYGILNINPSAGFPFNEGYIQRFFYEAAGSQLRLVAENPGPNPATTISWKVNWKITCF
jgi:hypothetical protein